MNNNIAKQHSTAGNNIPKLRFPEFSEEWEGKKLGDITNYVKGFAFKSEDYQTTGVRIVRVSDLLSSSIRKDNEKVFIDSEKTGLYTKYKLVKGNIIITTVGSKPEMLESAVGRGIYIYNNNEGFLNQNMLKLENIKDVYNGFVIGLLNTKRYQYYMKGIARGNANQANITVVDLMQYKVKLPTLPEQQKIASFLSSVDSKIEQLGKKKKLLEQYKKGVMQQIFSQQLRFKKEDGTDYPDWKEKKLGEVAEINPKSLSLPNSFIYVDLESVDKGSLTKENRINKKDAPSRAQRLLKINDIVYQTVRPYQKNNYFFCKEGDYVASTGYAQIRTENNSKYLYQYLHTDFFVYKVMTRCTGTSYPAINSSDLSTIHIQLPSIPEQTQIANFLSAIDTKIELVSKQLENTQAFKKGLLQQMFV